MIFEACARTGTAVEINSRPERRDPPLELLPSAVAHGCLFSIDTDAQPPASSTGCRMAATGPRPPGSMPAELLTLAKPTTFTQVSD